MTKVSGSPQVKSPSKKSSTDAPRQGEVKGTRKSDQVTVKGAGQANKVEADTFQVDEKKVATAKSIGVDTGKGNDRVTLKETGRTSGKVKVKTGLGADRVEDRGSVNLAVKTGKGDDQASLNKTENASLRGGEGVDKTVLQDVNGVSITGSRTKVYTSATNEKAGKAGRSDAANAARSELQGAIAAEKTKGKASVSLDDNGVLRVEGSSKGDNLTVRQEGGRVTVQSGANTLGDYDIKDVSKVAIDTGAGNDKVNVVGVTGTKVSTKTGSGEDKVNLVDTTRASVDTGDGADAVSLVGTRKSQVETGTGDDVITDVASKGLTVRAGLGKDKMQLRETVDAEVRGGGDLDKATLTDVNNLATRGTHVRAFTTPPSGVATPQAQVLGTTEAEPPTGLPAPVNPGVVPVDPQVPSRDVRSPRDARGGTGQGTSLPGPALPPASNLPPANMPPPIHPTAPIDAAPSDVTPGANLPTSPIPPTVGGPPVAPPPGLPAPPSVDPDAGFVGGMPGFHPGSAPSVSTRGHNDLIQVRGDRPQDAVNGLAGGPSVAAPPAAGEGHDANGDEDETIQVRP